MRYKKAWSFVFWTMIYSFLSWITYLSFEDLILDNFLAYLFLVGIIFTASTRVIKYLKISIPKKIIIAIILFFLLAYFNLDYFRLSESKLDFSVTNSSERGETQLTNKMLQTCSSYLNECENTGEIKYGYDLEVVVTERIEKYTDYDTFFKKYANSGQLAIEPSYINFPAVVYAIKLKGSYIDGPYIILCDSSGSINLKDIGCLS